MNIIAEVQKHPNARVFAFGIGSSVNRFLLDKMAEYGRGEVEYVGLQDDGSAAARRFHERVRNPLLTNITIDWSGLPVSDVYPKRIPDLFSAKPVVLSGRYAAGAKGVIHLRGKIAGKDFSRDIAVTLPDTEARHDVLATLWARRRIDDLMGQDWVGMQSGQQRYDLHEAVTKLGLEYNLMTQFTSFVAVEETVVTEGGKPRRIDVPVEMPHGMSYEGVFGERRPIMMGQAMARSSSGGGGFLGAFRMKSAPEPAQARLVDVAEMQQPSRKVDPSLLAQKSGKIRVRIWMTDMSKESLALLKALGVEWVTVPQTDGLVIATVDASKLLEVAKLAAVKYISPLN
jgi:Ca-activated chloride channel family protein